MKYFLCIFLIGCIFSQSCEEVTPNIIMDCSSKSNNTNSCCYTKTNGKKCIWYGSKINGVIRPDNNTVLHCDNPKGSTCVNDPQTKEQCLAKSDTANSCCYGVDANSNKKCIWFAEYYSGMTTFNNINYECSSVGLRLSILFALITLFIF